MKHIKRAGVVLATVLGSLAVFVGTALAGPAPDPETIAVNTATSLKDSLLDVFAGVAPVALLVMVAVFGIIFGVKLVRRFAR